MTQMGDIKARFGHLTPQLNIVFGRISEIVRWRIEGKASQVCDDGDRIGNLIQLEVAQGRVSSESMSDESGLRRVMNLVTGSSQAFQSAY